MQSPHTARPTSAAVPNAARVVACAAARDVACAAAREIACAAAAAAAAAAAFQGHINTADAVAINTADIVVAINCTTTWWITAILVGNSVVGLTQQ